MTILFCCHYWQDYAWHHADGQSQFQSAMGFLNPNARAGEDKEKRLRSTTISGSQHPGWSLFSVKIILTLIILKITLTKLSTTLMIAFFSENLNATDHSGVTFFLEKGGNDPAFPVSTICLPFSLSFNFQHKPGQCEPLLCRLDGVWVSRKVPGAAECSHFSLAGVSWAGSENWCEAPSSHLLWCVGRRGSNHQFHLGTFCFYFNMLRINHLHVNPHKTC